MKRWIQILVWMFLAFLALWMILSAKGWTQERQTYIVPNFNGGINVATDGTTLRPNEALVITNLTLDTLNVLTGRQGYTYWDSVAIDTSEEIQAIYIYEPYPDTQRMVIISNGWVYISPSLSDPGDVDWDTLRLNFESDSLDVTNGNDVIWSRKNNSWWYLKMAKGDELLVTGDSSGRPYTIDFIWPAGDYNAILDSNYRGANDTAAYTVYKKITGNPSVVQYSDDLFINNSLGFTFIYDDTTYEFAALLDSGIISDTLLPSDTLIIYTDGYVRLEYNEYYVHGDSTVQWTKANGVDTGQIFTYIPTYRGPYGTRTIRWSSHISDVDSVNSILTLRDRYPRASPPVGYYPYEITVESYPCAGDTGVIVQDTTKNWLDVPFGNKYLTSFYAVAEFPGIRYSGQVFCNTEDQFTIERFPVDAVDPGEGYYIFTKKPFDFTDNDTTNQGTEYPRFEQVYFYNNQMYGFGFEQVGKNSSETRNDYLNRLWYSDISFPRFMRYNYQFDVDKTEDITRLFELRGDLYIATTTSIWRFSGMPFLAYDFGDGILTKVTHRNGIPSLTNWAKATQEYGYFTNITGIYRFNGVRAEKISLRVDPIIKNNYASRIVMGYQDSRLYVSFPDSNLTLIYDERYDAFYQWDFGMTCFYAPPDTNIFYFGHSVYKGRVYFYPNGVFYDNIGDATGTYTATYESGWQDLGGYWLNKRLYDIYFPVSTPATSTFRIYTDFNATQADSFDTGQTGRYVYRPFFNNNCDGEYFKVRMEASAGSTLIFGGYRIEWNSLPDLRK